MTPRELADKAVKKMYTSNKSRFTTHDMRELITEKKRDSDPDFPAVDVNKAIALLKKDPRLTTLKITAHKWYFSLKGMVG